MFFRAVLYRGLLGDEEIVGPISDYHLLYFWNCFYQEKVVKVVQVRDKPQGKHKYKIDVKFSSCFMVNYCLDSRKINSEYEIRILEEEYEKGGTV